MFDALFAIQYYPTVPALDPAHLASVELEKKILSKKPYEKLRELFQHLKKKYKKKRFAALRLPAKPTKEKPRWVIIPAPSYCRGIPRSGLFLP